MQRISDIEQGNRTRSGTLQADSGNRAACQRKQLHAFRLYALVATAPIIINAQQSRLLVENIATVIHQGAIGIPDAERTCTGRIQVTRRRVRVRNTQVIQGCGGTEATGSRAVAVIFTEIAFVGHHQVSLATGTVSLDAIRHIQPFDIGVDEIDVAIIERVQRIARLAEVLDAQADHLFKAVGAQVQDANRIRLLQRDIGLAAIGAHCNILRLIIHAGIVADMRAGSCHAGQGRGGSHTAAGHINHCHAPDRVIRCRAISTWNAAADTRTISAGCALIRHQDPGTIGGEGQHIWQSANGQGIGTCQQATAGGIVQLYDTRCGAVAVLDRKCRHAIFDADAIDATVSAGIDALNQAAGTGIQDIHALDAGHPQGIGHGIIGRNFRQIATARMCKRPFLVNLIGGCIGHTGAGQ